MYVQMQKFVYWSVFITFLQMYVQSVYLTCVFSVLFFSLNLYNYDTDYVLRDVHCRMDCEVVLKSVNFRFTMIYFYDLRILRYRSI